MAPLKLPTGLFLRDGRPSLVVPSVDYDGLVDAMFHMIRQNGASSPAVLIRELEVLSAVISCEHDPMRVKSLQRHAELTLRDADRNIRNLADLEDVHRRYQRLVAVLQQGAGAFAEDLEAGATAQLHGRTDRVKSRADFRE